MEGNDMWKKSNKFAIDHQMREKSNPLAISSGSVSEEVQLK